MKNIKYKIDFIDQPEVFSKMELSRLYGGGCFIFWGCPKKLIDNSINSSAKSNGKDLDCSEKFYLFYKNKKFKCIGYKND